MSGVLKIMTCGSVDDGKSTLIGRLLYDGGMLSIDQKESLEREVATDTQMDTPDFSLLMDGLSFEREQGITIDVAYRYFATDRRSFIVADTPGHEEYTRNMAVAASSSDLAVLLVDANKGVLTQTRRHLMICSMMGISHYAFAVNKMDVSDYDPDLFRSVKEDIESVAGEFPHSSMMIIPVSALRGDHVVKGSGKMEWYGGPSLLEYLETVETDARKEEGFVMPVQRIARSEGIRYLQGSTACGEVRRGDEVCIWPGRQSAVVESISEAGSEVGAAGSGKAVALTIDRDIDVSRGHVITSNTELICSSMFQATVLWMDEQPMTAGKKYLLKLATQTINVSVVRIKYEIDPDTGKHISKNRLCKNEIARVDILCHEDLVYDTFDRHRVMGRFILIDKITKGTAACGTVAHQLRRADNISLQPQDVTRKLRGEALGQTPKTIWFTGLSGSGKSTMANRVEKILASEGRHTMILDGDNIRLGINRDLGFNEYDRTENIRRIAEIAKLMNDAGLIVITAAISPFSSDRQIARDIIGEDSFIEVYVSTPLEVCEKRDVKGLYRKAKAGEIPNFTGIGSPYEIPEDPEITVDTSGKAIDESVSEIMPAIRKYLLAEKPSI